MMLHERLEQLFEGVLNEPVRLTDDIWIDRLPGWDSVAHINLMFSLEQEFGIELSNREMSELQTVGDLKRLLRDRATAGSAGA